MSHPRPRRHLSAVSPLIDLLTQARAAGLTLTRDGTRLAIDGAQDHAHLARQLRARQQGADEPASGWIGRETTIRPPADSAPVPAIAILPGRLREALKRGGYELDAVIAGWREMGALHEKDKQRPPYLIPQRIEGQRVRCVVFTEQALDAGDDE